MWLSQLSILGISLVLSAFFSGMETAFITANKLRIELEKNQGLFSARVISFLSQRPAHFVMTMLLGNTLALVVYGIKLAQLGGWYLGQYIHSHVWIYVLETFMATMFILITAEYLPKAIFRVNSNAALNFFALPLWFFFVLLYPLTCFCMFISNRIVYPIFGVQVRKKGEKEEKVVFGKIDLDRFLNENQPLKPTQVHVENEVKFFQNALDFSKVKLRECMVPRPEIEAIDVNRPIEELKQKFIETGFSKILVFEDSIDNIIGYIHSSKLFQRPSDIRTQIIEPIIVPETMPANKLLRLFIKERRSIAVVVDEFGGTAGMVTIEDIFEEIFGEIQDEHDVDSLDEQQISENEFLFSGRLEIDYLNEKYQLGIPEMPDYETIAGFILYHYNTIPPPDSLVRIQPFEFQIVKGTDNRIELVTLKRLLDFEL